MTTNEILLSYIKKLSHPLKEIRERALQLLKAKLQLGWQLDDELEGARILVDSLLAWFSVQQPSLQKEALELLLSVVKTSSGTYIAREVGIMNLMSNLNKLKFKIEPMAVDVYEDILETLQFINSVHSQEDVSIPPINLGHSSGSETGSSDIYDHIAKAPSHSSRDSPILSNENENFDVTENCNTFKVLLFPWTSLSSSDSKTIILIEDALKVHKSVRRSCRFIRDVFLRDFLPEIFLNRPTIIQNLQSLAESNTKDQSLEAIQVLICITQSLSMRIKQLSCIPLVCQETTIDTTEETDDECSELSMAPQSGGADDGLAALRQLPAPALALGSLHAALGLALRACVLAAADDGLDAVALNHCTCLVERSVDLLLECVRDTFWAGGHRRRTHRDIAHRAHAAMRLLGELLDKHGATLVSALPACWLRLGACGERLARWARAAPPPATLAAALRAARLHPALPLFHPALAARVGETLQGKNINDNEYNNKYQQLTDLFAAIDEAVKFTKHTDPACFTKRVLRTIHTALPVLDLYPNDKLLNDIAEVLLKQLPGWELDDAEWAEARSITLSLMAHKSEWVQRGFYGLMADMMRRVFVEEGAQQESERCLTLLFDVGVLTEICCHGLCSESKEVQSSCTEMMLYMIRGRLVLSEASWWRLLASLLPALPLLHVYAEHDTLLGQAISKSLQPQIAGRMGVARSEARAGLARVLFARCARARADAAHALCDLLDEPQYLPPRESLRADVLLTAVCGVAAQDLPTDFTKTGAKTAQSAALTQILDVLRQDLVLDEQGLEPAPATSPPTLEPSTRLATLQQLAVMMMHQDLHDTFVENDGLKIVVAILRLSLLVEDFLAFPECALSCVSTLGGVCFGSRYELAKVPDLPALLLRVILIFPSNESAVLTSCQVLAVILWSGFVLQELDSNRKRVLSLPASVVRRTNLPFVANEYWTTSTNTRHSAVEWLMSNAAWRRGVRAHWALAWRGPAALGGAVPPGPAPLRLTPADVAELRALAPLCACADQLMRLQNATSHRQVLAALNALESYTRVIATSSAVLCDLAALPWQQTLARFLSAPPASPRDVLLLTSLLNFLISYMDHVPDRDSTKAWVISSILESEASVITLLSREPLYPEQTQHDAIDATQLRIRIVRAALRCVACAGVGGAGGAGRARGEALLKILLVCLERVDLKDFHSLGYLNELMRSVRRLVHIWPPAGDAATAALALTLRLLTACGGGGGRKGQGCRLDATLTLLALTERFNEDHLPVQRWSEHWTAEALSAIVAGGSRPELRAAALSLLAALAHHTPMLPHLINACPRESLVVYAAEALCDAREASCARAAAAGLVAALADPHTAYFKLHEEEIFEYFDVIKFVKTLIEVLVSFCSQPSSYDDYIEPNVPLSLLERRSELEVRARKCPALPAPPARPARPAPPPAASLVAAVCDLLHNVAAYTRCPVREWNDLSLFRLIFKCASWSSDSAADTHSVRNAACRVLARVAADHAAVRAALAATRDCLHALLLTIKPLDEDTCTDTELSAQTHAFLLLGALWEPSGPGGGGPAPDEPPDMCCVALLRALEGEDRDLQEAAVYCLTRLAQTPAKRSPAHDERLRRLDEVPAPHPAPRPPRCAPDPAGGDVAPPAQPEYLTEEFCSVLAVLYRRYAPEKKAFKIGTDDPWLRTTICLTHLLAGCARARHRALHCGLPRALQATLQAARDALVVQGATTETVRNPAQNPTLRCLHHLLPLQGALLRHSPDAKRAAAAAAALGPSLVRLWPWLMLTEELRVDVMTLLDVFTNGCSAAWNAATVCTAGATLVGGVCARLAREVSLLSRSHDDRVLRLALRVLTHVAPHQHARAIILKNNVLSCVHKLHLCARVADAAVRAWVQLVEVVSRYADGAAALLDVRAVSAAPALRRALLPALAHAAHHHRAAFMRAPELLELVCGALVTGDTAEVVSAARAVWALAANNHKAKLSLRSAGVSAAVLSSLERLKRARPDAAGERALQLLQYTSTVLQNT